MKKIIFHNLSVPYHKPPAGMFDFDKNGIFFATPGDIIVTRNQISKDYINFLEKNCGYNLSEVSFIDLGLSSDDLNSCVVDVKLLVEKLKSLVNPTGLYTLDSFLYGKVEGELRSELGLNSFIESDQYDAYSRKSAFRKIAKKASLSIPRGFDSVTTFLGAVLSIGGLSLLGFKRVVFKYDNGSAGIGTKVYSLKKLKIDYKILMNQLNDTTGSVLGFTDLEKKNFVVEGWYESSEYSPSIQFYVNGDGQVVVISVHAQLFFDNKLRYRGCYSSQYLPRSVTDKLIEEGTTFAKLLASMGYRGHLGLNSIVLKDGRIIWVELNPRRVMSSYVHRLSQVISKTAGTSLYYKSWYISKNRWKGKGIEDILVELEGVLFNLTNQEGVIPLNYGLLSSEGGLTLAAFSTRQSGPDKLIKYVESL